MVDLLHATSVVTAIRGHAISTPDRAAVILVADIERAGGATRRSYGQLDSAARSIAAWLQHRFPAGDRVLLLYPTGLDFVAAYLGCLYAEMVAVPAPLPGRYRHEQSRVTGIAENAAVSAILTDTESLPTVMACARTAGLMGRPVLATDRGDLPDPGSWRAPRLDHGTLAMLQYTSGATGEPKGVLVTHGNILHNADTQRRAFGMTSGVRAGGWVPHYHDMGLLGQTLPPLLLGGTCVLMRSGTFLKRPDHWLRMIDRYDLNFGAAPTFAYELCCTRVTDEQMAGLDLSRWRVAITGSEPVDAAVLDAFAKRFAPAGFRDDALCPCYGMAETTLFVSGNARRKPVVTKVDVQQLERNRFVPDEVGADLVSCGVPHDYDVLIADPRSGAPLPPGAVGEIWLRGPSIAEGYWHNDSATELAFAPDGYLRTGDLGALYDSELYVTGRLTDLMTVAGRSLYPQDIERELRARHAELAGGGASFTVPLGEAGNDEALVVTHEVTGRLGEDALRQLADGIRKTITRTFGIRLAGVGLLRRGGVLRTTSGKVQRMAMRRLFLGGELKLVYAYYEPHLASALRAFRQQS